MSKQNIIAAIKGISGMEHAQTKRNKCISGFIIACNCLAIFYMVYVVTASAGYTVLLGDDYTHGVRVGSFHVPFLQYVMASLQYMKEIYLDWQGTYFAMFLQALLSPINNFGLPQLRAVMMGNALLFFLSLFGVLWAAFGHICKEQKGYPIRLTVFTLVLFTILDSCVFTEIFFWYSGAVAYSIPLSLFLLSAMCFLIYNNECYSEKIKNILTICAAILLFLASGGSLAVSGTACYAVLLLTFGLYCVRRRFSVRNAVVLSAGIIGALINVAAPGNFSRHTQNSAGNSWRVIQSMKWAVKNVWREIGRLTRETMFGFMLLAMVLVGIYLSKQLWGIVKLYGLISVLALGTGYVTAFPVAFGYNGSEFPNRCYFVLDVGLALSLLNFAVFAGCCLERWFKLQERRRAWAVMAALLLAAYLLSPEKISDSAVAAMARSNRNGTYEEYYGKCVELYDYLDQCQEADVVVEVPAYIENFECFYLDEDAQGWVNVGMAQYYHKNSIRKKPE